MKITIEVSIESRFVATGVEPGVYEVDIPLTELTGKEREYLQGAITFNGEVKFPETLDGITENEIISSIRRLAREKSAEEKARQDKVVAEFQKIVAEATNDEALFNMCSLRYGLDNFHLLPEEDRAVFNDLAERQEALRTERQQRKDREEEENRKRSMAREEEKRQRIEAAKLAWLEGQGNEGAIILDMESEGYKCGKHLKDLVSQIFINKIMELNLNISILDEDQLCDDYSDRLSPSPQEWDAKKALETIDGVKVDIKYGEWGVKFNFLDNTVVNDNDNWCKSVFLIYLACPWNTDDEEYVTLEAVVLS